MYKFKCCKQQYIIILIWFDKIQLSPCRKKIIDIKVYSGENNLILYTFFGHCVIFVVFFLEGCVNLDDTMKVIDSCYGSISNIMSEDPATQCK